jgi:hypothetical protein
MYRKFDLESPSGSEKSGNDLDGTDDVLKVDLENSSGTKIKINCSYPQAVNKTGG